MDSSEEEFPFDIPQNNSKISRNPFVNYLVNVRQNYPELRLTQATSFGAVQWKGLPECDRQRYVCAAKRAKYVYKSHNKSLNRFLRCLQRAVAHPCKVEAVEILNASKFLKRWKVRVFRNIC